MSGVCNHSNPCRSSLPFILLSGGIVACFPLFGGIVACRSPYIYACVARESCFGSAPPRQASGGRIRSDLAGSPGQRFDAYAASLAASGGVQACALAPGDLALESRLPAPPAVRWGSGVSPDSDWDRGPSVYEFRDVCLVSLDNG